MYTIRETKNAVAEGIRTYLLKDDLGNYLYEESGCLPFYLEGAPGIGKTEIVKQVADELGIGMVSFSLVHHTRNSLLGLPVIKDMEDGHKFTEYTMSEIIAEVFKQQAEGYDEGILLLDEFPCMSDSVMPTMLAFLQNKTIGCYRLPRGWNIILCGNPSEYNKAARSFDAAVTDRIRRIEIEYSLEDFLDYAREKSLNPVVTQFVADNPDCLYVCDKQETVTCRGWENLCRSLDAYEQIGARVDTGLVKQFIKSEEIASRFIEYYNNRKFGFSQEVIDNIFRGKLSSKFMDKCKNASFEQKWNMVSYLNDNLILRIPDSLKRESAIKQSLEYISEIEKNGASYEQVLDEIFFDDDYEARALTLIENNDVRFSQGVSTVSEVLKLMNEIAYKKFADIREHDYSEIINAIKDTCQKQLKKVDDDGRKMSLAIDRVFTFLGKIDDTNSLKEKLFIEINKSLELQRILVKNKSPEYVEMCQNEYGLKKIS